MAALYMGLLLTILLWELVVDNTAPVGENSRPWISLVRVERRCA